MTIETYQDALRTFWDVKGFFVDKGLATEDGEDVKMPKEEWRQKYFEAIKELHARIATETADVVISINTVAEMTGDFYPSPLSYLAHNALNDVIVYDMILKHDEVLLVHLHGSTMEKCVRKMTLEDFKNGALTWANWVLPYSKEAEKRAREVVEWYKNAPFEEIKERIDEVFDVMEKELGAVSLQYL